LKGVAATVDVPDERGVLARAMGILKGLGVRVVDANTALVEHEPAELYFRFDQHLTPRGHEVVADLLLRSVHELRK
jgi:hypothetical protein